MVDNMYRNMKILIISLFLLTGFGSESEADLQEHDDACTTIIAMPDVTADGSTIIAKNRDLSDNDCQYFYMQPGEEHDDMTVHCQYISIPQIEETYAWVGFKSYNKWGIGMGINEFDVSIVDNDASTRERLEGDDGLHDNDLCRLVLERAKSAEEGVEVLTSLVEKYGQARTGEIYTIADHEDVWIVETTNKHWVAELIDGGIEVRANQYQIMDKWDISSEDLVEFASNWYEEDFSFAEAYTDEWPSRYSQTRYERPNFLLNERNDITIWNIVDVLQDHYEGTELYQYPPHESDERTICVDRTVGVMIVKYTNNPLDKTQVLFTFSSPCATPLFIPFYNGYLSLPESFEMGGGDYGEESAWWQYERLQRAIDGDYRNRTFISNSLETTSKSWYSEFLDTIPGEASIKFTYSKASNSLMLINNLYALIEEND